VGVPSLMEALESRRVGVLGQAERLREQIAGLSGELSRAEERLARLQIARETVEEVLAARSSLMPPGVDGTGGASVGGVAVALVKAEAELDATVMSPEYREIIALFATSGAGMRCKEVCQHLGLGTCRGDALEAEEAGGARNPGRAFVWAVQSRRPGAGVVSAAGSAGGALAECEDAFAASAGLFAGACAELAAPQAAVMTHAQLEDLLGTRIRSPGSCSRTT
jgi:hypothetical protein